MCFHHFLNVTLSFSLQFLLITSCLAQFVGIAGWGKVDQKALVSYNVMGCESC